MLDSITKKRIDDCRDILVGKVPDPKSQIEQITIALIYKFMDDMDMEAVELGGVREFFSGEYERFAWRNLFDSGLSGIDRVKLYDEAVERMEINPYIPPLFRNIFKNAYLPYRDPETLRDFLKYINDFTYDHSEKLGDAFEYLLSILGSQGDAGQFRTPRHIIDFMASMMEPTKTETILDPACGTAGFLISAFKHILKANSGNFDPETDKHAFEQHGVKLDELTVNGKHYKGDLLTPDERNRMTTQIKGYDISPDMVRLSLVNLYFHGFKEPHIYEYDTLTSEDRWNEYYDVILANPPFMSPKGGIRPHKRFSVQSKRSEVLFVDYMAEHLTANGRAAIIVPEGVIFQSGTAYKSLRKMLVDEHFLVGVISLPAGMFNPYSGVKTSILWLDKTLARKTNNILFVKIENDGFDLGAQRRPIKQNDLPDAFKKITAYKNALRNGEPIDFTDDSMVSVVSKKEIEGTGDYNLGGERYKKLIKISSDYPFVKLSDVCEINPESIDPTNLKDDEFVYVDISSVENGTGKIDYSNIIKSNNAPSRARRLVKQHDVLLSTVRPNLKAFGFIENPPLNTISSTGFAVLRTKEMLNSKFLFYNLFTSGIIDQMTSVMGKGAYPSINQSDVSSLKIPIPPLSIQEEIVFEIESYQQIIDGARQVVNNYKPRIDIDPDWEMVELGEVCNITSSKRIFKEEYVESGVPFYRTKEIVELSNGLNPSLELFIPNERYQEIKENFDIPKQGDILVSAVGTLGVSWIVNHENPFYFKDGNLVWIKDIKNDANPVYIKQVLDVFIPKQIHVLSAGAAYKALTIVKLKQLQIPLPDSDTQRQIVAKIEKEQALVNANKQLIELFEQRIKDRMAKVWGE